VNGVVAHRPATWMSAAQDIDYVALRPINDTGDSNSCPSLLWRSDRRPTAALSAATATRRWLPVNSPNFERRQAEHAYPEHRSANRSPRCQAARPHAPPTRRNDQARPVERGRRHTVVNGTVPAAGVHPLAPNEPDDQARHMKRLKEYISDLAKSDEDRGADKLHSFSCCRRTSSSHPPAAGPIPTTRR
jgi:hypothetical protein